MRVIRLNNLSYDSIKCYANKLNKKLEEAKIKIGIGEGFIEDIVNDMIYVYIVIGNNNDIYGWMLVKDNELMVIESFIKNKGVGSLLLCNLKRDYSYIKAEILKDVLGFYINNNFRVIEEYERRYIIEWNKEIDK